MSKLRNILVLLTSVVATFAGADAREWGTARTLRPVTWGIQQPSTTREQKMALAAGAAKTVPSFRPREIVIDVLVAYTHNAAQHYDDFKREIVEPAIEQANHSFRLSGIGQVRLNLAHVFQTGYVERGGHFEHVWHMADKGDGHMEQIHALREAHGADVVVLIVDNPEGCGLATRIGADADEAFAVVHHECAVSNYTVAHEIGHLIGARHELAYVRGSSWRGMMSYKNACGGCPRLPVWSNPLVLIGGEPTGTANLNNARIIAENAGRVASFR
jgi:hypothetical protein